MAKSPPLKLLWHEAVTDWLAEKPELPVSRAAVGLTVSMVVRATTSQTNEALVSARWVEEMTGVNQGKAAKALATLERAGWITWTQRSKNKVKVYRLTLPSADTVSAPGSDQILPGADASADPSADTVSDTPVLPVLQKKTSKEKAWPGVCSNCEEPEQAHAQDCPYRPFDRKQSTEDRALELLRRELGGVVVEEVAS